jgi:hypothetical protein
MMHIVDKIAGAATPRAFLPTPLTGIASCLCVRNLYLRCATERTTHRTKDCYQICIMRL